MDTDNEDKASDYEFALDKTHPHDKMFQKAMQHQKAAISLIENHVPDDFKKLVDLSTIKAEKDSFVARSFKKSACDVLLSAKISGTDGYILFLCEHQSSPDHFMAFRLMEYTMSIWSMYLKRHPEAKRFPLVYPIILYNGQAQYNVPRQLWDLCELSQKAKEIWTQDHPVINVNDIPDEEFAKMGWIGALEFFLKHWYEKDFIPVLEKAKRTEILPGLLQSEDGINYFETLLHYLLTGINKDDKIDLDKIISSSINKELGEKFMPKFATSLAKHWLDEGKAKGIELGKAKGKMEGKIEGKMEIAINMLNYGADIKVISSITGLDIPEIQRLKTSLK